MTFHVWIYMTSFNALNIVSDFAINAGKLLDLERFPRRHNSQELQIHEVN